MQNIFSGVQDDDAVRPLQGNPDGNYDNGTRGKGWFFHSYLAFGFFVHFTV